MNGGAGVTSGGRFPVPPWLAVASFIAVALIQGTVNVFSTLADRAGSGIAPWEVWTWEVSSLLVWFSLAPLIWIAVARLQPPHASWPVAALALAALTLPVSLIHVAAMTALRKLVYAVRGTHYVFANDDTLFASFLYEYRKDIGTFILFALIFGLMQWIMNRPSHTSPAPPANAMLPVRDGATAYQVPIGEIDYLASAGNYVEIHWGSRTLLHRATLTAVETELAGHGFVRIHRSILVSHPAIRRIATSQSGDFTVTLASGEELKGSRRFRLTEPRS